MRAPRLIGTVSIVLGLLLSAALLLMNFNPFNFAFQASITIANKSDREIKVSPIGIAEGNGELYPLPRHQFALPIFPAVRQGRFHLRSGEALELSYDWDDIIFTSVVIEAEGLTPREIIVEPGARVEDCCYVPKNTTPLVTNLESLPLARPQAIRSVERHSLSPRVLLLWLPALGPLLLLAGCLLFVRSFTTRATLVKGDA